MSSCQCTRHYIQLEGLQTFSSEKEPLWWLGMTSALEIPFLGMSNFLEIILLNKNEWIPDLTKPVVQGIVPQWFFMPSCMFHFYASFKVALTAYVVLFVSKSTVLCENTCGKLMNNRQILWQAEGEDRSVYKYSHFIFNTSCIN